MGLRACGPVGLGRAEQSKKHFDKADPFWCSSNKRPKEPKLQTRHSVPKCSNRQTGDLLDDFHMEYILSSILRTYLYCAYSPEGTRVSLVIRRHTEYSRDAGSLACMHACMHEQRMELDVACCMTFSSDGSWSRWKMLSSLRAAFAGPIMDGLWA